MNVGLPQSGCGDADKSSLFLKAADITCSKVSHSRLQAADKLIDRLGNRSLGGHHPDNSFGNQLVLDGHVLLAIPVPGTFPHA